MSDPAPSSPGPPIPQRPRAALALVVAMVALLVGLLVVVDSRDDPESRDADRVGAPISSDPAAGSDTTPVPAPPATGRASARLRVPTPESPLRVWVGGDSLAAGPSAAVWGAARDTGVITPLAEYQVGTGLVRDEFWDWPRHLDGVLHARDPEVVIFMVGANDDQPLAVDGTSYRLPDQPWLDEYRKRVATLMELLTKDGRRAIWIGMPPMRDPEYSAAIGVIDQIYLEEAARYPRMMYVDAWALFSGSEGPGSYAQELPGTDGALEDVRLDDGIHLSVAGSRRLAAAVMERLGQWVTLPTP